jgi:hypothetical protein
MAESQRLQIQAAPPRTRCLGQGRRSAGVVVAPRQPAELVDVKKDLDAVACRQLPTWWRSSGPALATCA